METTRTVTIVEKEFGGLKLTLETGKVARQAHGACTVQYGETVVLATVLAAPSKRDIDYFPLYVDYREMRYAGGKVPGGFFKREGRPTTKEVLSCRMIDRTIRPLFPDDYDNEVQVQCIVVATDRGHDADVLAMIGGSAALTLSPAPFLGPTSAVRVGRVDGEFVLFPTYEQREQSDFDLVVSGHKDGINMIELGGKEVPEDVVVSACEFAAGQIRQIVEMIEELASKAGAEKSYEPGPGSEELQGVIGEKCSERLREAKQIKGKTERTQAIAEIRDQIVAELCPPDESEPRSAEADVRNAFHKTEGKVQRELVLSGRRPDGRAMQEVRPISIDVPALPRVHGSALFSRGETQSLATVTLGTPRDQQKIDGIQDEYFKRFILHYNFPPFSVGEIRPVRGPSRRDIGHGALAEKCLAGMLPATDDFPYTVRVVSEILESNGSSSMASVCGATLALMDAGVPIKNPVAGVSIGMVREGDQKVLLTDIAGEEDFHGDMDFKVAGTREGITGIQLDTKPISGIDVETIREALAQAKEARLVVLDEMAKAIAAPRPDISRYAPRMVTISINPEKIGKVIGPGGKTINGLSTKYEVTIDIEDDGTIFIAGADADAVDKAKAEVEALVEEVKVGQTYSGKVVRVENYGAFVELIAGQDGLCHRSELDVKPVTNVSDLVKVGDVMEVKVLWIDEQGKIRVSRKAILTGDDGGSDQGAGSPPPRRRRPPRRDRRSQ